MFEVGVARWFALCVRVWTGVEGIGTIIVPGLVHRSAYTRTWGRVRCDPRTGINSKTPHTLRCMRSWKILSAFCIIDFEYYYAALPQPPYAPHIAHRFRPAIRLSKHSKAHRGAPNKPISSPDTIPWSWNKKRVPKHPYDLKITFIFTQSVIAATVKKQVATGH